MKMTTYIARRALLLIPVLVGVVTITFVLFTSLPVSSQLYAHFGAPSPKVHCGYEQYCPCRSLSPTPLPPNATTCECPSPPQVVTPATLCANPVYQQYYNRLGLNQPIYIQWAKYLESSFTFHWGYVSNNSYVAQSVYPQLQGGVPVTTAFAWMLPYTIELAVVSLLMILAIAIPLGNLSAVYRNRPIDQASRLLSFSGYALPAFLLGSFVVLGMILLVIPTTGVYVHSPWCPSGEPVAEEFTGSLPLSSACYANLPFGSSFPAWIANGIHSTPTGFLPLDAALHGQYWLALDTILRLILPAFVITFGTVAVLLRFVRNSMLEVMNLDYVRTARSGGVPESVVIRRHAGRNSLNVTVTVLGLTFASFLGGFPVLEDVFSLNGVGNLFAQAANPKAFDFGILFGSTILFTYIIVGANLAVDLLYAYLDPRVRLG